MTGQATDQAIDQGGLLAIGRGDPATDLATDRVAGPEMAPGPGPAIGRAVLPVTAPTAPRAPGRNALTRSTPAA